MTGTEKLLKRYRRERNEFKQLVEELHEDGLTSERRAEIREQAQKAFDAASATQEDLKLAQQAEQLHDIQAIRRDVAMGGGARRDGGEIGLDDFRRRATEIRRHKLFPSRKRTDEQIAIAEEVFPGEDQVHRAMLERITGRSVMTEEQRKQYESFMELNKRAIAGGYVPGTAGQGAEYVPTVLESTIFAQATYEGPLATDEGLNIVTVSGFEKRMEPVLNRDADAEVIAASTDANISRPATSNIELSPWKYTKAAVFAAELFEGAFVDFEAKIVQIFGASFGVALNKDRTIGDGASKITGFVGRANAFGAGGNSVRVVADSAVTEVDLSNMCAGLHEGYLNRPTTRIHISKSLEFYLWTRRTNGVREFQIGPDRRLIMPLGTPYVTNPALLTYVPGATPFDEDQDKVAMIADHSAYFVLYAMGGMRMAGEYEAISDQVLMTMRLSTDGKPADASAAFSLAGRT